MTVTGSGLVDEEITIASFEKAEDHGSSSHLTNPVIESANFAFTCTNLVQLNREGIKAAAKYIQGRVLAEEYSPRTWRTQPLHLCPPEPYEPDHPLVSEVFNWIFVISALNFNFWSEREDQPDRYGVEWQSSWSDETPEVWTGYWSLVAALNRAISEKIPVIDPAFYSSEKKCPDSLIEHIFRPAPGCSENIPLLKERISILREVGSIICARFDGSFKTFWDELQQRHGGEATALDFVCMVTETFPSFRDEILYDGRRVFLWKRAQILVAELWAAFYPSSSSTPHPLFPGRAGPMIEKLTMFADYRVPQILHHLKVLTYSPALAEILRSGVLLAYGSREELSIRAASIVAVERMREELMSLGGQEVARVNSVIIDFYLWDLAKRLEVGADSVVGIETAEMLPAHRTRSIWY